jgi:hypothetical protein
MDRYGTVGEHLFETSLCDSIDSDLSSEITSNLDESVLERELADPYLVETLRGIEEKYAAVIVLISLKHVEEMARCEQVQKDEVRNRKSMNNGSTALQCDDESLDAVEDVVCQCIALDFIPTPIQPCRYQPVVTKRFNYTRTGVFIPQVCPCYPKLYGLAHNE